MCLTPCTPYDHTWSVSFSMSFACYSLINFPVLKPLVSLFVWTESTMEIPCPQDTYVDSHSGGWYSNILLLYSLYVCICLAFLFLVHACLLFVLVLFIQSVYSVSFKYPNRTSLCCSSLHTIQKLVFIRQQLEKTQEQKPSFCSSKFVTSVSVLQSCLS